MANRGRMLRDTSMVTMESLWELWDTVIAVTNGTVADLYDLYLHEIGDSKCDIFLFLRASDVGFCQITLAVVW